VIVALSTSIQRAGSGRPFTMNLEAGISRVEGNISSLPEGEVDVESVLPEALSKTNAVRRRCNHDGGVACSEE
jgi:hypothetical protein